MSVQLKETSYQIAHLSKDKVDLLKRTICKGASDDELEMFLHTCAHLQLDPFMKQVYAVKRKDTMTIQTSIDGYRLLADRTGKYMPGRAPTFTYNDKGDLISATAYVLKLGSDGQWHEVSAIAFWDEYVVEYNGKPTNFWEKMPHNMLSKCAETLALRKAFPAEMSAVRTEEEMAQADVESAKVNQKTGEIEEISVLYMSRNHVEELEFLIGEDKDFLKSVLTFYRAATLDDIPDMKFPLIKEKALQRVKIKEGNLPL